MIRITCDSTCDLPRELYDSLGVTVIPLSIALGEEFHYDGTLSADEIYAYVAETGKLPSTSAISIGQYDAFYGKFPEDDEIIHISLSSELSSSHQNACIAAYERPHYEKRVSVIDSKNLSTGSGLLVMKAVELRDQGLSREEIVDELYKLRDKLDVSFVLQTLDYLKKGGRCSAIVALGANLMKLRPEIVVSDGKMSVGKKYRGSIERSVADYIRGRLEGRDDIDTSRIFVTHSGVPEEVLTMAMDLVKELHPFTEVLTSRAGCTITSHCGPGTLGVLFFKK